MQILYIAVYDSNESKMYKLFAKHKYSHCDGDG